MADYRITTVGATQLHPIDPSIETHRALLAARNEITHRLSELICGTAEFDALDAQNDEAARLCNTAGQSLAAEPPATLFGLVRWLDYLASPEWPDDANAPCILDLLVEPADRESHRLSMWLKDLATALRRIEGTIATGTGVGGATALASDRTAPLGLPPIGEGPLMTDPVKLPARYALRVSGTCLEPLIRDGSKVAFSKHTKVTPGGLVVIWRRPECTPAGEPQAIIKRLISAPTAKFPFAVGPISNVIPLLFVSYLNPPRCIAIDYRAILALHACIGVVAEDAPARVQ